MWPKANFDQSSKFHFRKQMASCESTGRELSSEWSHHRISSIDSKVRVTLQNPLKHSGNERVHVACEPFGQRWYTLEESHLGYVNILKKEGIWRFCQTFVTKIFSLIICSLKRIPWPLSTTKYQEGTPTGNSVAMTVLLCLHSVSSVTSGSFVIA